MDDSLAFLRVIYTGTLGDVIYSIHAEELKQAGYKKVMDYVSYNKYFSTYSIPTCSTGYPNKNGPHSVLFVITIAT